MAEVKFVARWAFIWLLIMVVAGLLDALSKTLGGQGLGQVQAGIVALLALGVSLLVALAMHGAEGGGGGGR